MSSPRGHLSDSKCLQNNGGFYGDLGYPVFRPENTRQNSGESFESRRAQVREGYTLPENRAA